MKVNTKIFLWIHLQTTKYHQHRKRSKTDISLVIILNVFKCLKVSLVPLKFFFGNSTIFIYFSWDSLWICYGGRYVHFIVPSQRRDTILLDVQRCTHSAANTSKYLNLRLTSYYYAKVTDGLEKTNKEFSCAKVFIMRLSDILQFVFGFNEWLWAIFSLDYQIWEHL